MNKISTIRLIRNKKSYVLTTTQPLNIAMKWFKNEIIKRSNEQKHEQRPQHALRPNYELTNAEYQLENLAYDPKKGPK